MKDVHRDLFDQATDIFDKDGYKAAEEFLRD